MQNCSEEDSTDKNRPEMLYSLGSAAGFLKVVT